MSATALAAPSGKPNRTPDYEPAQRNNMMQLSAGTIGGVGYLRKAAPSVWIGGAVSFDLPEDSFHFQSFLVTENNTRYNYDMKASTQAVSALGQINWLSSNDSGFLLGGLVGGTQLKSNLTGTREWSNFSTTPLEVVSLNQSLSSFGLSGGLQLG